MNLGLGIGWRPELARWTEGRRDLGFVEVIAEDLDPGRSLPTVIRNLRQQGLQVIPHGISLSLGGAEPLLPKKVQALAALARQLESPFVSEHVAFVRAGGAEAGHLLPLSRTPEGIELVCRNVRQLQDALPVPLALENVAGLFEWPQGQMEEADFFREILERTGALLLLDLANIHANTRNHGGDPLTWLDLLPLDRLAYVHVAGGIERNGLYHDTHAHPVPPAVLDLLAELARRTDVPGVLLERDDAYPESHELDAELDQIKKAWGRSERQRSIDHAHP